MSKAKRGRVNKRKPVSKVRSNPPVRKGKAQQIKESKQAKVLALLRRPSGTTIGAIVRCTGWQPHSVRGFLTAVVRRKLKLDLQSKKDGGKRVYWVSGGMPPVAGAGASDQPSA
jgi:hypothetical protein